ncbi:MAG: MFS transporter [Promethearchaeota archaeon]|jgi:MFS family permease
MVYNLTTRKIMRNVFDPTIPKIYYELLIIGFNIMIGMSLSASFLPILANNLDPSGVLVGLVVSAWFLSRIFIELPAGIISDRVGRRRLLILGLGLSLMGPILCSQAKHVYVLILGRAIWGMGTALYFMNNMALLMEILPTSTRGKALGIFQGIDFIGSFIGAPLGAWLATYISFTKVFYVTTFFTLVSFLIALKSKEIKNLVDEKSETGFNLKHITSSLSNWNILIVCLCNFLRMIMRLGIYQTVLLLYLNKNLGLSVAQIGWIVSMRIAGMVIFLFIAGILSDRFGRKPVLIVGFILSGISFYFFSLTRNLPFLLFTSFLGGVGDGLDFTTLMALLTDIAPTNARGMVVGLFRTFQDIGGFTGPIVFMMIYTSLTQLTPFYIGIGISILNILLVTSIRLVDVSSV